MSNADCSHHSSDHLDQFVPPRKELSATHGDHPRMAVCVAGSLIDGIAALLGAVEYTVDPRVVSVAAFIRRMKHALDIPVLLAPPVPARFAQLAREALPQGKLLWLSVASEDVFEGFIEDLRLLCNTVQFPWGTEEQSSILALQMQVDGREGWADDSLPPEGQDGRREISDDSLRD